MADIWTDTRDAASARRARAGLAPGENRPYDHSMIERPTGKAGDRAGLSVEVEHEAGPFALRARFSAEGGITALFGPSGSGKTTLCHVVGGLVRPRRGRVVLDGRTLLDTDRGIVVPPHRRRIGYVFQEGRLFPHLTVRRNLGFGRWFAPRRAARPAVAPVAELLGIAHLLDRYPGDLSGGEKQRVAIGRALLAAPRLLLMDEPLASLDEARKAEILPYLERLRDEAGIPILYVSHGVAEVARLATTLVVLGAGEVAASGPAAAILARLDLPGLAGAREGGAILAGNVRAHDPEFGLTVVATVAGDLHLPALDRAVGARVRVQVAARDVMVATAAPGGLSALNVLPGRVAEIAPGEGPTAEIRLDCGGAALVARVTRRSVAGLGLHPGRSVFAIVKSASLAER